MISCFFISKYVRTVLICHIPLKFSSRSAFSRTIWNESGLVLFRSDRVLALAGIRVFACATAIPSLLESMVPFYKKANTVQILW